MDELLNNAPCGFLVFADDGTIVEANATLLGLLGFEREDLLKLHIEKIFSVAGRIFYQTHFFPLLKLHGKIEELYLDLRSKTGENIPVLINGAKRKSDENTFYDCIFVAMRKRSQYEDEILKAKKEAEAATLAKDEFLSVVSHELRTPLNAILGWARMLQSDSGRPDAEILKKGLGTIQRNAQIQTQLIEDILDFSRIISGKLRMEVGQVNLTEVIEAAIDVLIPTATVKNIRIQKVLDSDCTVYGDADRLQQVMWNLLTNAVKFTPKNGRVQVRMQCINSSIEICVSDTGKGIKPEFLPYIFERFQQEDKTKTRRHGGLGLGLAITYRIVELHGGTIRAESPGENAGATFTVTLPVTILRQNDKQTENDSSISKTEQKFAPDDARLLKDLNILIVDDEADARELIEFILVKYGASVTAAGSVAEAFEKLRLLDFDLVISDIEMPDEDGFSLIRKLKDFNKQQKRKIPAVALTAHARPSERLKVLSAGYQMHLAKPVEPAELLAVITNLAEWNRDK